MTPPLHTPPTRMREQILGTSPRMTEFRCSGERKVDDASAAHATPVFTRATSPPAIAITFGFITRYHKGGTAQSTKQPG